MSGKPGGTQAYHILTHRKAEELLGDGEWHDLEMVIAALMPIIPASIGERRADTRRAGKRDAPKVAVRPLSKEAKTRSGRRYIITSMLRSSAYEIVPKWRPGYREGPPRKIRMLRPPRFAAGNGDPWRVARDNLMVENDRLKHVVDDLAKLAADKGYADEAEKIITKRRRKR